MARNRPEIARKRKVLSPEKMEALLRFGIDAEDLAHEAIVKALRKRHGLHRHRRSVAVGKNGEPAFISRPYLAPLGARSANAGRIRSAVKEVVSKATPHKAK